MRIMRVITVVSLALGLGVPAMAQQRRERVQPVAVQATIDVSRLPVNLQRIQRELRQSTIAEQRDGLNLRYQIEVFGRAPEVRLFTPEDNLGTGPVPYGAPTHQEIVRHITPKEFSSPVMDFSALARWLAQKTK